ncbi:MULTISPECIES: hypothetical protein [unclassified Microbacterium]|uniref:hypothetical protein n=1 Tax=unclassified Microbacterium TaxID=2609290 RepID=UPI0038666A12
MAADLVLARTKKGAKREFLMDARLVEKYPDDYVLVEKDPELGTNEVGLPIADPQPPTPSKTRAKKPAGTD